MNKTPKNNELYDKNTSIDTYFDLYYRKPPQFLLEFYNLDIKILNESTLFSTEIGTMLTI